MPAFKDLPSPEQMQHITEFAFQDLDTITPVLRLTAHYTDPKTNEITRQAIHWPNDYVTGGERYTFLFKTNSYDKSLTIDQIVLLVFHLLLMITGHPFIKTDETASKQIWMRKDCLEAQQAKERSK